MAEHYFAEQRRFHLSLQAQRVNFDQFLQVRGQTVEQFRAELHANAERRLRSRLGLLLVADKEGLWPSQAEVDAALAAWDDKRDGERTFPANDARKARQKLASQRAEAFVLEHSHPAAAARPAHHRRNRIKGRAAARILQKQAKQPVFHPFVPSGTGG